jgi:hypothetical protein
MIGPCPMTQDGRHRFTGGWRGRRDGETSCSLCHQTWEFRGGDILRSSHDFLSSSDQAKLPGTTTGETE